MDMDIDNDILERAINERDKFLKIHPHLIEKQKEIDEILDKCNQKDRLEVIRMLMIDNMMNLQKELLSLQKILVGNIGCGQ